MNKLVFVKPGIYRHQKGDMYIVMGTATNCTNIAEDMTVVVYWSLKIGPDKLFVRELGEFFEPVRWADGKFRARFIFEDIY